MLSRRLTGSGLLLIFLAGAMCLCGALSYGHLAASGPAVPPEAHQAFTAEDAGATAPEHHGPAGALYTAALFAFLGAAVRLLLRRARVSRGARTFRSVSRALPRRVPSCVQAPPQARLQVFLL
ncbi:hypothetical protein Rxycam_03194 [Rubrobacter xylanophilus DSM 9941]|uniref:hypothetical protein n=1 Tax=Rubrobacter xylanophilus TaxID=49319 RepID=UPI001C64198A|nr:hypothetical protein [Rubrobacter xylanophilus]QYJ17346.1 hypothetical protein Rxycam_03194 [Rubrobacter xylanophilus DSM 9941]